MVERVFSPLSLQAVAQGIVVPFNSPRFTSLCQQVVELGMDELGLFDNWLAWYLDFGKEVGNNYTCLNQFSV